MQKIHGSYHGEEAHMLTVDPVAELVLSDKIADDPGPTVEWTDKAADAYLRAKAFSKNQRTAHGIIHLDRCDPIAVSTQADGSLHYTVSVNGWHTLPEAVIAAYALGQGMNINEVGYFVRFVERMVREPVPTV